MEESAPLVILRAKEGDASILRDLNSALFSHDGPFDLTLDHQWPHSEQAAAYFFARARGDEGIAFIAWKHELPVGYLIGNKIPPADYRLITSIYELENMFVLPQFRGQGIGKALVQTFQNWCGEGARVRVDAYAANSNALAFYRAIGFLDYSVALERW